jgi:hypothetical protein
MAAAAATVWASGASPNLASPLPVDAGAACPSDKVIAPLLLIAALCIVTGAVIVLSLTPGCFAGSVSLLTYTAYQSYCLLYG